MINGADIAGMTTSSRPSSVESHGVVDMNRYRGKTNQFSITISISPCDIQRNDLSRVKLLFGRGGIMKHLLLQ